MTSLILRSSGQLQTDDWPKLEVDFDLLSPSGQVRVFRGVVTYIAPSIPMFVRIPLGEPAEHIHYDEGLRVFESVTTLGPDVTWADRVYWLIPLKCGNRIGDSNQELARWFERGIFLRSDGCLLEVCRTSEIQGALIRNTTPLEVSVSVMSDERLIELVACRGEMKSLFREVIGLYRGYIIDEYGRIERAQKLQEFCAQFRFLVSRAHLEEH